MEWLELELLFVQGLSSLNLLGSELGFGLGSALGTRLGTRLDGLELELVSVLVLFKLFVSGLDGSLNSPGLELGFELGSVLGT